jgi:hypothetical protein
MVLYGFQPSFLGFGLDKMLDKVITLDDPKLGGGMMIQRS